MLGNVYCTAIEGCQEVSDFRRVAEWTQLLQRWCEEQPGLVAFTGQCALHRGQVMRARGAWDEALEELEAAVERYRLAGASRRSVWPRASSATSTGCGASRPGRTPPTRRAPSTASTRSRARPCCGCRGDRRPRPSEPCGGSSWRRGRPWRAPGCSRAPSRCSSPSVTSTPRGRVRASWTSIARSFGSDVLAARAALVWGLVEVACDAPAGALPHLRRAHQGWVRLDMPYESALAQAATGRALLALGDTESGRRTLAAARQAFVAVGARPDVDAVDRVVGPPSRPAGLSEREVEVLRLVAAGQSNAQIAAALVISDRTVARHLSNIFTKIDVGSRTAAASYAFAHDLL